MSLNEIKSDLDKAREFAAVGNWAGVDQILQSSKEKFNKDDVREIYKILSQKMIEKCENDVQKIDESKFSWEYAGVIEMVEEAMEYAKKAEAKIPKLSEKTIRVMKLVYDRFIILDLTKAENYKERKDKSLAMSYAKMAKEILERAKLLNSYSSEEIRKREKDIDNIIVEIDR